ncbi:type VI secretion system tube protein Hcp [Azospirillum sp. A1-3]|uniref:Hcp family type VI secretion system effector n=1 Tax=Azospirillum sp. A1-3 TaxID=185874 RepID=UPI0020773D3D|nr:type VI secretion system tube protein Hcp [Azospirillum sp. A1-3]MCM8738878.1 type VI secretion system tube protein Hcp [Azospirillum sp. A1-3]
MAYDVFIDIDGIQGESMDSKYKDKIAVRSFSFGVAQAGTFSHNSGGGAGKADFSALKILKHTDSASHLLFLHCASGTHIKQATVIVRKAGGEQRDFFKILLSDLLVQSFNAVGDPQGPESQPLEEVTFNYSSIKISYAKQKQDGSMEAFKDAGWSLKENKKL